MQADTTRSLIRETDREGDIIRTATFIQALIYMDSWHLLAGMNSGDAGGEGGDASGDSSGFHIEIVCVRCFSECVGGKTRDT